MRDQFKNTKASAEQSFAPARTLQHHICETPASFLAQALQNPDNHFIMMQPVDQTKPDANAPRPLKLFDPASQSHLKRVYALSDENGLVVAAATTYNVNTSLPDYNEEEGQLFYLLDISVHTNHQGQGHMKALLETIMADFEQKGLILGSFFTKHEDSPKLARTYAKLHPRYPELTINYEGLNLKGHSPYSVVLEGDRVTVSSGVNAPFDQPGAEI